LISIEQQAEIFREESIIITLTFNFLRGNIHLRSHYFICGIRTILRTCPIYSYQYWI